ncbi:MAG TPA: esterase-like activity of phytase family protein [Novosphingobium sp.]|nr:esterase-like activity of phytase family protein [Novosphingobium sp.]
MRRLILILLVALGLAPGTWLRSDVPPPSTAAVLTLNPLPLPAGCCAGGAFTLTGAWELTSPNGSFGGYSALLADRPGRLLALSDRGYYLEFAEPGLGTGVPLFGPVMADAARFKANRDIESAAIDLAGKRIWIAQEGRNGIARHRFDLARESFREPPEMAVWSRNSGPEAMVRLADGRFVVLCECTPERFDDAGRHPALVYAGDPTGDRPGQAFTFAGPADYRPTDMAQLPDGRVLVVVRRLTWPVPARFAIKLALADPREITPGGTWTAREVLDLGGDWPVDNYEGLAIEQLPDGRILAWLISDENGAVTQRVLLLRLEIDPARL